MNESFDTDPLFKTRNLEIRLRELEHIIQSLQASMYLLVADFNFHLEDAGVRGQSRVAETGATMTVRARVHRGTPASVTFGLYDRQLRKFKTRSRILDVNSAGENWMLNLKGEKLKAILRLDRRRRILNHKYSVAFAERKSLRRFHEDELGIRAALESQNTDQSNRE